MDIADIATREYVEVDADTRLGKVRSLFEEENPKGIIVTREGEYEGVVGERQLLQSHVEDDTKVAALVKPSRNAPAPKVDRTEDIRETARVLVEGGTKVAPVFEGGELWGIITEDAILQAVLENLDALDVGQIYTENVITITENDGVGKAINLMRENAISRLPVVDDDGMLSGVVTTHDIIDFVTRNEQRITGKGDRAGDLDRMLDIPAYDVMSSPVATTSVDESVRDAVEEMLDNDYSGLVVTPENDDRVVGGVLTRTDVLRALTYTEEEHMDVQITNIELLDTISRQDIRESIEQVSGKYSKMHVRHAHVRFQEHQEKLRGTPLILCQIRMRTNRGQMMGSGEGYGSKQAFHVALDKLERNVLEQKGMQSDEEYRGQLLRKLGEL
ncbi:CBS domain-containing protein [Halostella sp. JP-L12]|uniref:CBS domain-containing protein n=1 Tax=Halostella TaxID=1843185 RepID=UPI000EF80D3B|nr:MULTISPECIES: CBS domain-containing protein [Halostella]NHN47299.1 CBS domain-containing protein [Halostella sp. JP-L12]